MQTVITPSPKGYNLLIYVIGHPYSLGMTLTRNQIYFNVSLHVNIYIIIWMLPRHLIPHNKYHSNYWDDCICILY